ncbi:hypothetical protein [Paludisphaera borealis]|uniref:DUF3352 domain-containing protein n=1 Tax=Paludisphaera borealis TaxID=1387353 RepID=A0A1U7CPE7_9BACT|nr:hypothetical protein [Paludisphaera borealis]APW60815.1 hypothetical protein BSF38_02304 [Paludisphaera borealis]
MMRIRDASSSVKVARRSVLGLGVVIASTLSAVVAEEPPGGREPAIVVRAVHPDRQAAAVVGLFADSRSPHPAAAMAAWRRATADISQLGKPLQAVAAIFNPQMIAEWKAFHDVELAVGFAPEDGKPLWRVIAPEDDGTLSALITSLRLSGGANEPPIADPPVVVERLGGPGAAVGARLPEGVAFAGRRDELASAVQVLRAKAEADPKATEPLPAGVDGSGFRLSFDLDRLAPPGGANLTLSRIATAARAGGVKTSLGRLALDDDHLDLNLSTGLDPERVPAAAEGQGAVLDPSWLACVPAQSAQAAVAIAFGRGADYWNRLFDVADRVDRADPARAQLAPLRVRLNFLAMARGVRLEADLWPILRGVTVAGLADPRQAGRAGGVLLALHTDRAEDAERILARVVRPMSGLFGGGKNAAESKTVALGRVSGRPLEAAVRGTSVLVGWGDKTLELGLQSIDRPEHSAAAVVERERAGAGAGERPTSRAGVYWPGRLALPMLGLNALSPLTVSLSEGAPVVWRGGEEGGRAWDLVRWPDLRRLVARFLDRVPQSPPDTP